MDIPPILVAVCLFGLVCAGTTLLGGFFLVRVAGVSILTGILDRGLGDDSDAEEPYTTRGSLSRTTRSASSLQRDMETRAQSLDFDEAINRYRGQGDQSSFPNTSQNTPSGATSQRVEGSSPFDPSLRNQSGLRRDRRGRRSLADREDERYDYLDQDDEDIF